MPVLAFNLFIGFVYLILFSKLLWYSPLNEIAGVSKQRLLVFYWIKATWCLGYYIVHLYFLQGGDTVDFFQAADQVYRSLYRDPLDYLRLVFLPNHWYVSDSLYHYNQAINRYGDESTFFLIRLNAIFRLFSFGSYWAQMMMFSFVTLPGILMLYRFLIQQMALNSRWALMFLLYLPATAFWIHGVHKEALLLSAMGLSFYSVTNIKRLWWLCVISLFVLGLVRSHYLLLMTPLLTALWVHERTKRNPLVLYAGASALILISVALYFFLSDINPITYIFEHRAAYAGLSHERILHSDFWRWLLFSAIVVLVSPLHHFHIHQSSGAWVLTAMSLSALMVLIYPIRLKRWHFSNLHVLFILTAILEFVIIGLIVVQDGGIARYRAPMLVLLLSGYSGMFVEEKNKKYSHFHQNFD